MRECVTFRPVLQLRTRILDLPLARKMWSPRALSLSLPVTSSTLLHPVTSDPHCCSWFRRSSALSHTSHTHTLPSFEPLNTSGPWDCGEREDHSWNMKAYQWCPLLWIRASAKCHKCNVDIIYNASTSATITTTPIIAIVTITTAEPLLSSHY